MSKPKLKLIRDSYYGFDSKKVRKKFEGELTYIGDFSINMDLRDYFTQEKRKEYHPVSVYHSAKPNRDLGHKDYMLLFKWRDRFMVSGRDEVDIEEDRYQLGKYCEQGCGEVIYSMSRHDYKHCSCGSVMVDGGKDYFRSSEKGITVKIDLLTGDVSWPKSSTSTQK